jgi:hypothetical protein
MYKVVVEGDECHGICDFGQDCCPHDVIGICMGGFDFESGSLGKKTQRVDDPIDMKGTCPHLGICPTNGISRSENGSGMCFYKGKGSVRLNVNTWRGPNCRGIHDVASSNVYDA